MFTAYTPMTVNVWGSCCNFVNASVALTGRKGKDKRSTSA